MSATTDPSTDSAGPRAQHRSQIHGRRILYVDDEPLVGLAVVRMLRGAGAVCLGTDTHAKAVELLALEPHFDLAILEFEMPDGDVYVAGWSNARSSPVPLSLP